jgi:hypothetical protein
MRHHAPVSLSEMGSLLQRWIEWHDRLDTEGRLRFRCPVEPESQIVSRVPDMKAGSPRCDQREPVIGYLLVDASDLDEATEIARGCPGLEQAFTVEICRPFERRL